MTAKFPQYPTYNGGASGSSFNNAFPQYPTFNNAQAKLPQFPQYTKVAKFPQYPGFPQYPTAYDYQKIRRRRMYEQKNLYNNPFTDPYAINSLSDVIFNSAAKDKRYGKNSNPLEWLGQTTHALFDHVNDSYVQPIFKGDWGGLAMNTIGSLGEDLDILSNPIKGMIVESGVGTEAAVSGGIGAAIGALAAGVLIATTPVGWVTGAALLLGGSLTGAGLGATGAALVTEPEKAALGFQRALGLTDEGKYNYNIETGYGGLADFAANLALDPSTWISFGLGASSRLATKQLQNALAVGAQRSMGRLTLSEVFRASDSLMDYMYAGLRSLDQVDNFLFKTALNVNPIGVGFKSGKFLFNTSASAYSSFREMLDPALKLDPLAPVKEGAITLHEAFSKGTDGINRINNPLEVEKVVKMHQEFYNDIKLTDKLINNLESINPKLDFDMLPADLTPLREHVEGLMFDYYKKLPGASDELISAHVIDDFRRFLIEGDFSSLNMTNAAELSDLYSSIPLLGVDNINKLAGELTLGVRSSMDLSNAMQQDARVFARHMAESLGTTETKLSVLTVMEDKLKELMGVSESGMQLNTILGMMSSGNHDLVGYYKPLLEQVEQITKSYDISMDDLKSFMTRNSKDLERAGSLATEFGHFTELGRPLSRLKDHTDLFPLSTAGDLRYALSSEETLKLLKSEVGTQFNVVTSKNAGSFAVREKLFSKHDIVDYSKIASNVDNLLNLDAIFSNMSPNYKPQTKKLTDLLISSELLKSSQDTTRKYRAELQALHSKINPGGRPLTVSSHNPKKALDIVEKRVNNLLHTNSIDAYDVIKFAELRRTLEEINDFETKYSEFGVALDNVKGFKEEFLRNLSQSLTLVEVTSVVSSEELIASLDAISKVRFSSVDELITGGKGKRYYIPQLSKTQQVNILMDRLLTNHKDLIKSVDNPDSALNLMYRRVNELNKESNSPFTSLEEAFKSVFIPLQGGLSLMDYSATVNEYLSLNFLSQDVYTTLRDFLNRYDDIASPLDPGVLREGLLDDNSHIYSRFKHIVGKLNGLDPKHTNKLLELTAEYLDTLNNFGVPRPVFVPGAYFDSNVDTLFEILDQFSVELVGFSKHMAEMTELQSASLDIRNVVDYIDGFNSRSSEFLIDAIPSIKNHNAVSDFNRLSQGIGLKSTGRKGGYAKLYNRNLSKARYEKFKEEFGDVGEFQPDLEVLGEKVHELVTKHPVNAEFGTYVSLNENYSPAYFDELHSRMALESSRLFDGLSKYTLGGTGSQYLYDLQNTNAQSLEVLTKFTSSLKDNIANDVYFDKNGSVAIERNFVRTLERMTAEELAQAIKFSGNSDFFAFDLTLAPKQFTQDALAHMHEYGIIIERSNNYMVIKKVAKSPLYDALKPVENRLGFFSGVDKANPNYLASEELMGSVGRLTDTPVQFTAANWIPYRLEREATEAFLEGNPELALLIGEELVEDALKKLPRSRGLNRSFFGNSDFLQNFHGVHESGNSYMPRKPFKAYANMGITTTYQQNDRERLISVLMNPDFAFSKAVDGMTDKEAFDMFKNLTEVRVAYLSETGKVRSLKLTSVKDIKRARNGGYIITDQDTLAKMHSVINPQKIKDIPRIGTMLSMYQRHISPLFTAPIFTLGAATRNILDIAKKNAMMNPLTADPKEAIVALQELSFVNEIVAELGGDVNIFKASELIKERYPDALEAEFMIALFEDVYKFSQTVASGGGLLDAESTKRFADAMERGTMDSPSLVQRVMFDNPITKMSLNLFGMAENFGRWSLYRAEKRVGSSMPVALSKVINTHFDYASRSMPERVVNIIAPFTSFGPRNFLWWADNAFRNKALVRASVSTISGSYLEDDYRAQQMTEKDNKFLLSQFMAGNILDQNGKYSTLLKTNPSLFEAFHWLPEMISDPLQRLSPPLKDALRLANGDITSWDELNYPLKSNIKRLTKKISEDIPNIISGLEGNDEDWRFLPGIMATMFNVTKFEDKEYFKKPKLNYRKPYVNYGPRQYPAKFRRTYPKKAPFIGYGADAYRVKGGRALSTGHVTKGGNFRASNGIGYGNPMVNRMYNDDMHIRFGKKGPWLANAPVGVRLKNINKGRSIYEQLYSRKGNARMKQRMKQFDDPRGLYFALQDMKYNG